MFLGCGVAAYSAAIFHLMTHAFFKALLFLAAGSVIHGLGGEQDLRKMGGLWRKLPVTFAVTTVGVCTAMAATRVKRKPAICGCSGQTLRVTPSSANQKLAAVAITEAIREI